MRGSDFKPAYLLLPLLLAACATRGEPGIRVEYVDRPVIQQKYCLQPSDIPKRPGNLSGTAVPSNLEKALDVAMAKVSEWIRYGNQANVLMNGCAK